MNNRMVIIVSLLALLAAGCERSPVTAPESAGAVHDLPSLWLDPAAAAGQVAGMAGWTLAEGMVDPNAGRDDRHVLDVQRKVLGQGIAHYTFVIETGPGAYDRIALHRVVKEQRPGKPVKTDKTVFLQHGDAVGFVKFLYGTHAPSVPDHHSVAYYLAHRGVDVWGIDQNWVLVPADETDFGFMQYWGLDNQIENLRTALAVARHTRLLTGAGFQRLNLLGYSSGCVLGFAYVNDEAARPEAERHVSGFVPVDLNYKYAPEDDGYRQWVCDDIATYEPQWAAGLYQSAIFFRGVGELAANDPDGDSPYIPGLTNLQAALVFGGETHLLFPLNGWFHYFGAYLDADGMPAGLRFLSIENMTDFMQLAAPFEPLRFLLDYELIECDEVDVPWDDHLADIEVPILYIGPAGGAGDTGHYTLTLLGSTDVEILRPSVLGPDLIHEDFGHIDIWTAWDAPHLVWQPLHQWLVHHRDRTAEAPHAVAVVADE